MRRVTAQASRDSAGEPLPGRYYLVGQHRERCPKIGFGRDTLIGQRLYDDGSHGDIIPGDGVYTLAFAQTSQEGTRNFLFHMRGRTADGIKFTRTRRLSRYIRIQPASAATNAIVQAGPTNAGQQLVHVYLLPRYSLSNYLGPGFAHRFRARVVGARLLGPIIDLGNGYYDQALEYPTRRPAPVLEISMAGTCFVKKIQFST